MHNDASLDNETEKPDIIPFFNSTKKAWIQSTKCVETIQFPGEHADGLWQYFFNFSTL